MTEMLYPTPTMTNFIDILTWMNDVTGGLFWVFTAIALFFILFFSLKMYPTTKALATASFVTSIYVIGLRMIGLVNSIYMILFIVVTAITVLILVFSGDGE